MDIAKTEQRTNDNLCNNERTALRLSSAGDDTQSLLCSARHWLGIGTLFTRRNHPAQCSPHGSKHLSQSTKQRRNYPPRRRRLPLLLRSRGKTALLTHPSFDLNADNVAIQFLPADSLDMVPRTYTALDASDGPLANPFRFLYRHLRIFVSPDRDKRLPCWQLDCKRPSNQRLSPRHEFVVGLSQHQGPPSTKESKCK